MSRSFGIVESKMLEADFFLDKLKESANQFFVWQECQFYFSAFLSSARSVTFALQASINGSEELEKWYKEKQDVLKNDKESRFFVEVRNLSQKIGYCPISGGRMYKDNNGNYNFILHFDLWNTENLKYIPEEDVITVSERFFMKLLEVIQDCYANFGYIIDSRKHYTVKNMKRLGKTVEDLEEELGFPRGWMDVDESSKEERMSFLLEYIRSREVNDSIDLLFIKYLGTDRFGKRVKGIKRKK